MEEVGVEKVDKDVIKDDVQNVKIGRNYVHFDIDQDN